MNKTKILGFVILISINSSCEEEESKFILYKDIIPDLEKSSFISPDIDYKTYSAMATYDLDLNQDKFPDFEFSISHNPADNINIFKDDFHIKIRDISQYLTEYNVFAPKFSVDNDNYYQIPKIQVYNHGDTLGDHFINYMGWIYKVDGEDSITTEGDFYVGLKLVDNSKMDNFYGWVHLEVKYWKIIFKEFAYSTIPNRKIKFGEIE